MRLQRIESVERLASVLHIAPGLRQPFLRRADLDFEHVRHAETRAQQRAVRGVQPQQGGRGMVVQRIGSARDELRADRRVARHRAFQAEE